MVCGFEFTLCSSMLGLIPQESSCGLGSVQREQAGALGDGGINNHNDTSMESGPSALWVLGSWGEQR